jgi:hypothetical protein
VRRESAHREPYFYPQDKNHSPRAVNLSSQPYLQCRLHLPRHYQRFILCFCLTVCKRARRRAPRENADDASLLNTQLSKFFFVVADRLSAGERTAQQQDKNRVQMQFNDKH